MKGKYERRETSLIENELNLSNEVVALALKAGDTELLTQALKIIAEIKNHLAARNTVRPYKLAEIRRP